MKSLLTLFLAAIFVLQLSAQDAKFKKTVKLGGRIQYDFEFMKREKNNDWFNGNEFRRVELAVSGKIAPKLKYKLGFNFSDAQLGFRDVYLKYTAGSFGNFAVGSVPEPTGLEVLTSSKHITIYERAMISALQDFKWGAGFHYENFQLVGGRASFQLAVTNSNGNNKEGFKDSHLEKGTNWVARITGTPLFDKENHRLLHLGVNFAKRPAKDLKFRAENHMGGKYHYVFPDATGRTEMGFELGTTFGPFSLQGEYKTQSLAAKDKDFNMSGYYTYLSYFITGEHRPYKHGHFGRVKPVKDISNGGFGAIELLARYSNMTPSKDVIAANEGLPEAINNLTFGINWYLNAHAKIMYNFISTDDGNTALGKGTAHLLRFAMDF